MKNRYKEEILDSLAIIAQHQYSKFSKAQCKYLLESLFKSDDGLEVAAIETRLSKATGLDYGQALANIKVTLDTIITTLSNKRETHRFFYKEAENYNYIPEEERV